MYAEQSSRRSGRRVRSTSCSGHERGCDESESIDSCDMDDESVLLFVGVVPVAVAEFWREYDGGVAELAGRLLNVSVIMASLGSVMVDGR